MKAEEFLKSPKLTSNVVLICGEESYLRDSALRAIKGSLDIEPEEFNLNIFQDSADAGEIVSALTSAPCFASNRLVIANNFSGFKGDPGAVADMLENISEQVYAVFTYTGAPDKRKKLYKSILKHGLIIEADTMTTQGLVRWIGSLAKKRGAKITKSAAELMVNMCGTDMYLLMGEADKCFTAADTVTDDVVKKYAIPSEEHNVFMMHQLMLNGDTQKAMEFANNIVREDGTPLKMMAALTSKFKQMYMARACIDAGYSDRKTQDYLVENGVKPYAAMRAADECRAFEMAKIIAALKLLSKWDYDVKTGKIASDFGLDFELLKLYIL